MNIGLEFLGFSQVILMDMSVASGYAFGFLNIKIFCSRFNFVLHQTLKFLYTTLIFVLVIVATSSRNNGTISVLVVCP